jgi:hypothetical protein
MAAAVCGLLGFGPAATSSAQPAPGEPAAPPASTEPARQPPAPAEPAAPAPAEPSHAPEGPAPTGPPAPVPPPTGRFSWEPFGYLRLQYVLAQNDPEVQFVGRDDGFELQNARIGVRGSLEGRAAFVLSIDGAVDERAQINVPEGRLRVGLRDAYGDVVVRGKLVVRAGFFQSVMDPQALISDTARAFVDKPIESRGVRATQGFETPGLTPGRSLGAALRLDPEDPDRAARVGFELAIQNGADEYSSNNDNDKPAVSAAVLARLPRQSWLIAAGRYNPRSVGALPFRQDETDLQAVAGLYVAAGPVLVGGGAIFQRTTFPTTGGPHQNAVGGHAELLVRVAAALPVAFGYRFGILDPSSLLTTDRVMEHTAGATIGVPRYRMRVQAQLTYVADQRELANSRAQLAAELAL